jgi:hypothetical protein
MANNSGEYALKALAEQVFGTKVVEILKEKKMTYRDIWETSSPTTQCGNTIGDAVDGVSVCWLCGYVIDISVEALRPECEHVLPVGQALVFLDLYKHSVHKGDVSKELDKMLKLEYRWAHSVCNRIKSDTNFLGFNSKGEPIILEGVIRDYLTEIYSKSDDIKGLVGRGKIVNEWSRARIADISKQLNGIIKYINTKTSGLLLLSGVAALFEPDNIASSLRDKITPEKVEVIPKIDTISSSFNKEEYKTLLYFIQYRSNVTSQISLVVKQLSLTLGYKLKEKDKDSKFILALRNKYNLTRTSDYDTALYEELMSLVREHLTLPFEKVMETDEFRGLYLTYSAFLTPNQLTTDLFNPFMLELIYMCLLCLLNNQIARNPKLNGALDGDIEAIQQIWLTKCKEDYYKLFFCRMTELYINQGVISKDVVKCVIRVDCSGTSTKLANVAKVQFYKNPNVAPKAPNVVPTVPKAPNVVPTVPKAPNVVPTVPKAPNVASNVATKGNSCPVCPASQSCPAVPNCPQGSKEAKTMLQQLLDEVERERTASSMFGGKRKSKNVKFYF